MNPMSLCPPAHCSLFASTRPRVSVSPCLLVLLLFLPGCTHPSEDNIRLRKINQELNARMVDLTAQNDANQRTIAGLEKRISTIPMLPPDQLKNFWLTSGLQFGRLSGGINLDDKKPGDQALRIYICPTDEFGSAIQAAGSFTVEAFDLAEPGDTRLGRWDWDAIAAKRQWRSFLFEYGYELTCPWQKPPNHSDITVRVTFTDELTHIPYTAQTVVRANIPPAPATAPTSAASR